MHKISFNAFHLNTFTTHRTAFAVRIIFFNSAVHFSYRYKEHYSFLLRLLRRTLLYHLLPRTTFVREEASRDEALRTTWAKGMEHLLPFNSTSVLYWVFSTLCARSICVDTRKQKKHFFEKLMSRWTTVFIQAS